ncbi:DUF502 domain-containing protein [Spongiibacter taiwanensis]|uniref:DUF502 domain-containing protein n=1 Tax=Spongiibacter taiwanensis TaxID=1748242 RepID=UPI002034E30C|nr:DUF502 domain-containing protein [Spongiibacter taiwanensis]USA43050.1 DUF502 domain-containing protein [Spongiibacter taiwanensis]
MRNLSGAFLRGMFVLLPVVLSIQLAVWVISTAESWLAPPLKELLGPVYFPGMALLLLVALTVLVGLSSRWPTASFVWGLPGRVLERTPVLRQIYGTLKDVMEIMGGNKFDDEAVVMVELPNSEARLIGIVTVREKGNGNTMASELDDDHIAVYLPMSYQVGGYTVVVPRQHTRPIDMRPADALQLVLSGGVVSEPGRERNIG